MCRKVIFFVLFVLSLLSMIKLFGIQRSYATPATESHVISVPYHSQVNSYYCGEASLEMVFDYYGADISQYEIANVARVESGEGTYADEMVRAGHFSNLSTSMGNDAPGHGCTGYTGRDLGCSSFFNWFSTEYGLEQLKAIIDQNRPIVVATWYSTSHTYGHYRVVIGYDDSGIIAHDPWDGPNQHYSYSLFMDLWSYYWQWGLFTSPWSVSVNVPETVIANSTFEVEVDVTYTCPDPFDYWNNEYPADSCNATIQLPSEFLLPPQENSTKVLSEDPLHSRESRSVSWQVIAPENAGSYSISVLAEGLVHGSVSAHGGYSEYDYDDRIGGVNSLIVNMNGPPSAPSIDVTPNLPLTNDDLMCDVTVPSTDPDGDTVTYIYEWYKNGNLQQTTITSELTDNLSSTLTAKDEVWKCVVTPFDGIQNGTSAEDQVVIENSKPSIDSYYPQANPIILEGGSQEFNITKSDLDGDSLTVTWRLNQTDTGETSNSYTYTANFESAGTYNVTVIVSDGLSQTSHRWTLTVTNVQRDIAIVNITPSKNIVGEGCPVSINVTITNQGELTETFNIILSANSAIINQTEATLPSQNTTILTFVWNTTGVAKENYIISANVTILPGETDIADNSYIYGILQVVGVGNWTTTFIGSGGYPIVDFAAYNGKLYAASDGTLYVYNGSGWNIIDAPTFILSMEPFQDKLVIGGKGGLYSYDGTNFTLVFSFSNYIKPLGVYSNTLYAGAILGNPPTLYYCNGSPQNPNNWHIDTSFSTILIFSGPFGSIDSFKVYNNKMYISSGGTVYSFNGTYWSTEKTYIDVCAFLDMKVYNGKLYLATRDQAWRKPYYQGGSGFCGRVIEFDGDNWVTVFDHEYWIFSLETYAGKLYAGTANKIYTYNGTDWAVSFESTEGAYYAISLITFNGKIYAGMGNRCIFADPSSRSSSETVAVPEFPSFVILPLFTLAMTVAVLIKKKRVP